MLDFLFLFQHEQICLKRYSKNSILIFLSKRFKKRVCYFLNNALKLIILLLPLSILAQNADCVRMMSEANALAKNKDFQKAINKYTAAATCDSKLQQQAYAKINEVFVLVEKETPCF